MCCPKCCIVSNACFKSLCFDNIAVSWLAVAGVEVASAKTQTSKLQDVYVHSDGYLAGPTQFVVGTFIVTDVCAALHHIM